MTVAEKSSIRDFSLEDSAQVKGVIVVDIDAASVAKSFFLKGDIIQVVNGTKIEKVADLQKALKKKIYVLGIFVILEMVLPYTKLLDKNVLLLC